MPSKSKKKSDGGAAQASGKANETASGGISDNTLTSTVRKRGSATNSGKKKDIAVFQELAQRDVDQEDIFDLYRMVYSHIKAAICETPSEGGKEIWNGTPNTGATYGLHGILEEEDEVVKDFNAQNSKDLERAAKARNISSDARVQNAYLGTATQENALKKMNIRDRMVVDENHMPYLNQQTVNEKFGKQYIAADKNGPSDTYYRNGKSGKSNVSGNNISAGSNDTSVAVSNKSKPLRHSKTRAFAELFILVSSTVQAVSGMIGFAAAFYAIGWKYVYLPLKPWFYSEQEGLKLQAALLEKVQLVGQYGDDNWMAASSPRTARILAESGLSVTSKDVSGVLLTSQDLYVDSFCETILRPAMEIETAEYGLLGHYIQFWYLEWKLELFYGPWWYTIPYLLFERQMFLLAGIDGFKALLSYISFLSWRRVLGNVNFFNLVFLGIFCLWPWFPTSFGITELEADACFSPKLLLVDVKDGTPLLDLRALGARTIEEIESGRSPIPKIPELLSTISRGIYVVLFVGSWTWWLKVFGIVIEKPRNLKEIVRNEVACVVGMPVVLGKPGMDPTDPKQAEANRKRAQVGSDDESSDEEEQKEPTWKEMVAAEMSRLRREREYAIEAAKHAENSPWKKL